MHNHRWKSESRVSRALRGTLVRIVIKRDEYDVNLLTSGQEYIFLCHQPDVLRNASTRGDWKGATSSSPHGGGACLKKTVRQSCATFNHVNGQKALSLACKAPPPSETLASGLSGTVCLSRDQMYNGYRATRVA